MPDARTHDLITIASGFALIPIVQTIQSDIFQVFPLDSRPNTAWFVLAHMLSGIMFSPDLDLDSAIDDRWGILFWIWRPYMWAVPHRNFWSHSLIFAPLLRLAYFYFVVVGLLIGGTWVMAQFGIVLPNYPSLLTEAIENVFANNPDSTLAFLCGFCSGGAAHTIADWVVTSGKRFLRMFGIRISRDYSGHDRYIPRGRRLF